MPRLGSFFAAATACVLLGCGGSGESIPLEPERSERPSHEAGKTDARSRCLQATPREAPTLLAHDALIAGIGLCGELPYLSTRSASPMPRAAAKRSRRA
ncbi:MAG TPA: hypothetical protein VN033_12050 [Vulgatibacter sp.]|nr:hypothetical protein [Vulgatibacter sp.]